MADIQIFSSTVDLLGKSLDLRAKRQAIIAGNLANAETPNYTPSDLSFEAELKNAVGKGHRGTPALTNPRHIPIKGSASSLEQVTGEVVQLSSVTGRDGNGVELESEMGRLAENQIMYNATVQLLSRKFEGMKQAIRGTL